MDSATRRLYEEIRREANSIVDPTFDDYPGPIEVADPTEVDPEWLDEESGPPDEEAQVVLHALRDLRASDMWVERCFLEKYVESDSIVG